MLNNCNAIDKILLVYGPLTRKVEHFYVNRTGSTGSLRAVREEKRRKMLYFLLFFVAFQIVSSTFHGHDGSLKGVSLFL